MSTNTQNDGKHRADEIFAARRRYVTQLCGFRRTGSFSRAEPGAFEEFDLWKKHKLLNEIIIGCSRLEAEEDNEDFPNQLLILIDQIEYINLRVSFGRFELLQVYNYLVKNPQMPGNPINEWRHICLDFVNEIADATSDRHLSRTSYVYAEYVSVYKRLLYAEVELEFGKGSHTQYIDCVKKSISEKGQVRSYSSRLLFTKHQPDSWLFTGNQDARRSSRVLCTQQAKLGPQSSSSSSTPNV